MQSYPKPAIPFIRTDSWLALISKDFFRWSSSDKATSAAIKATELALNGCLTLFKKSEISLEETE